MEAFRGSDEVVCIRWVEGLGFWVEGLGFRSLAVEGLKFRNWGSCFMDPVFSHANTQLSTFRPL